MIYIGFFSSPASTFAQHALETLIAPLLSPCGETLHGLTDIGLMRLLRFGSSDSTISGTRSATALSLKSG
jgi:hypothetical protein